MFWFTVTFLGILITFLLWYYGKRPLSYWRKIGVKQGSPYFFLGDTGIMIFKKMSLCEYIEYIYKMFPEERYSGIYQFTKPTLLIRDPELIKTVAVKDFDHFVDHNTLVDVDADPLMGGHLVALSGQKWRDMRATVSPIFTSSKIKIMYELMAEAAKDFVKFFLEKKDDLIEVELKETFTRYTNDVIATTAFGIKVDSLKEPNNSFYKMGQDITDMTGILKTLKFCLFFFMPKVCKFLDLKISDKKVTDYFVNVIEETIKAREEKGISRPDLINLFLELRNSTANGSNPAKDSDDHTQKHNKDITNMEITAQAFIFFFAGFDTVSIALCFGSYELAVNQEIQDKLREEIRQTWNETNGKITYDVLLKMKYLDMVVSEILRKWPPAISLDRRCTKPYTISPQNPGEIAFQIRKGDMVWVPVQGIHRDPVYYPDPEKLDPERFSDENKEKILPYTYIPFGSGPRNCIGSRFALLEVKTLLVHLLYHFQIVPIEKSVIPVKLSTSVAHTAEGGFWFGLKKIQS